TLQFILLFSGPHYTAYRKAVPLVAARWRVCRRRSPRAVVRRIDGRRVISRWVDGGATEGNPEDLPAAPHFVDGWTIRNSRCDHSNARRVQARRAVRSRPRVHLLTAV